MTNYQYQLNKSISFSDHDIPTVPRTPSAHTPPHSEQPEPGKSTLFSTICYIIYRLPRGQMVIVVDFWIHWLKKTRVQTPVLELNWSELEVVVAGEGGRGRWPLWWQKSILLSGVCNIIPQPDSTWTTGQKQTGWKHQGTQKSTGEKQPVQFELYICSL